MERHIIGFDTRIRLAPWSLHLCGGRSTCRGLLERLCPGTTKNHHEAIREHHAGRPATISPSQYRSQWHQNLLPGSIDSHPHCGRSVCFVGEKLSRQRAPSPVRPSRCWTIKQCPLKGQRENCLLLMCRVKRHLDIPNPPNQRDLTQVQPIRCWTL